MRPLYLWLLRRLHRPTLVGDPHAAPRDRAGAARARVQLQRDRRRGGLREPRTRTRSRRRSTRRCTLPFLRTPKSADGHRQASSSTRRTTARGCRCMLRRRSPASPIAATIFLFTAFYMLRRRGQDRGVRREQDSAALRRAAARARDERARRAVRRDLLHVAHADAQVADHPRDEPGVPGAAGRRAGDRVVHHRLLPDRRLVERVRAGGRSGWSIFRDAAGAGDRDGASSAAS